MKLRKLWTGVAIAAMFGGVLVTQPAKAADSSLVIGSVLDIDKTDPHTATNFATVRGLGLVYGSLIEIGAKNAIKGGLATSWIFSKDGKTLTLNLREGVKFHDGSTFDADDAKASLERILDTKTGAAARANIATITSIKADGDDFIVTGDLTIKDVTKSVELKVEATGTATDPFGNVRAGFEGTAEINRKDFGLTWNVALEAGGLLVSEKIKLQLDISAIKQA